MLQATREVQGSTCWFIYSEHCYVQVPCTKLKKLLNCEILESADHTLFIFASPEPAMNLTHSRCLRNMHSFLPSLQGRVKSGPFREPSIQLHGCGLGAQTCTPAVPGTVGKWDMPAFPREPVRSRGLPSHGNREVKLGSIYFHFLLPQGLAFLPNM